MIFSIPALIYVEGKETIRQARYIKDIDEKYLDFIIYYSIKYRIFR